MALKTNMISLVPARERLTKIYSLPSRGFSNPTAFPGGQIRIFPWDVEVDERLAKVNQANGEFETPLAFMVRLLRLVADLNGSPADKFVTSEITAVLMISRALTRNDSIDIEHRCQACGTKESIGVGVPHELETTGAKAADWPGYDVIILPDCKDVVKVRMLTVGDEMRVVERTEKQRNQSIGDAGARVIAGVVSVNDSVDVSLAEYLTWYKALSPSDSEYLHEQFNLAQPKLNPEIKVVCGSCQTRESYTLRLDQDFFRRESNPRPETGDAGEIRSGLRV